jgi:hypothetical protein
MARSRSYSHAPFCGAKHPHAVSRHSAIFNVASDPANPLPPFFHFVLVQKRTIRSTNGILLAAFFAHIF